MVRLHARAQLHGVEAALDQSSREGRQDLERALRLLRSGWTGFRINGSSVLGRLEAALLDQVVGPPMAMKRSLSSGEFRDRKETSRVVRFPTEVSHVRR
jgi:hypothetical protein